MFLKNTALLRECDLQGDTKRVSPQVQDRQSTLVRLPRPSLVWTSVQAQGDCAGTLSLSCLLCQNIFSAFTQCLSATLEIDQISFSDIFTHAKNDKNVSLSKFLFFS